MKTKITAASLGFCLFALASPVLHAEELRELSTDRPDKTESPYTVDKGHFQAEMDLWNMGFSKDESGATTRGGNIGLINAKVGVTDTSDLQVVVQPLSQDGSEMGLGDTSIRYKQNLYGASGQEPWAFALMPYIKLPTQAEKFGESKTEGGLIALYASTLPEDIGFGAMLEWDYVANEGSGYHHEWVQTVTFSHDIIGELAGYAELYSMFSSEAGATWASTFDFGFTYGIAQNVQFDAGINIGLTDAAEDLNPFVGLSFKI